MRQSRPHYPRPQTVALYKTALETHIPVDEPMKMGMRESAKLIPNWRFQGLTGGVQWVVDVYCGKYCYVAVRDYFENVRSIPAVIRFLQTHLLNRGAI